MTEVSASPKMIEAIIASNSVKPLRTLLNPGSIMVKSNRLKSPVI